MTVRVCVCACTQVETSIVDVTTAGYVACGKPSAPCGDAVVLACKVPAMKLGSVATVALHWNGGKSAPLKYEGIPGANKVYSAEYVTSLALASANGKTIQVCTHALQLRIAARSPFCDLRAPLIFDFHVHAHLTARDRV